MIYLDNAATTPVKPEVLAIISSTLQTYYGNPSSTYALGKQSKSLMEQARQRIADLLQVDSHTLYFTSGATEANNWAIYAQAMQARALGLGNHIVVSAIEHPSVMAMCEWLSAYEDFTLSLVYPNAEGAITLAAYEAASQADTIGWIAMAVNNETGTYLPIEQLGQAARARGYWFHVDAVQAIGRLDYAIASYVTSFSSSGHKLNAPKGIGLLYYAPWRSDMVLRPYLHGGGQERQQRSGTENLAYIMGYAEALSLVFNQRAALMAHYDELATYLIQLLQAKGVPFRVNGDPQHQMPYILNIWFKDQLASQLLIKLDLAHIAVSAGSACSAGTVSDSKILKAFHPNEPATWHESLRISFGYQTTKADVEAFVATISK